MAKDLQSFNLVEHTGFTNLLHLLEPRYRLPSRQHFSKKIIPRIVFRGKGQTFRFEKLMNFPHQYLETLKTITACAFSCNGWTSVSNDQFLTLSIHWISSNDCSLHTCVLKTSVYNDRHTSENIAVFIKEELQHWALEWKR